MKILSFITVLLLSTSVHAAAVLDWENSGRHWGIEINDINTVALSEGHTVTSGPIGTLDGFNVLILGEPDSTPTAGELTTIQTMVEGGGTLIIFGESGCGSCTEISTTLSAIGSSITYAGGTHGLHAFPSAYFTTAPRNIVGGTLDTSLGTGVAGGTALAGGWAAFEQLGSGLVVVFGDRSDFDGFHNSNNDDRINTKLILNILDNAGAVAPVVTEPVPTLAQWSLILLSLLMLAVAARHLQRRKVRIY